jgi:hypothetical protein
MVEIWKTFLPNFLEFTLVFYIFFLDFFWISNLRPDRSRRISKTTSEPQADL